MGYKRPTKVLKLNFEDPEMKGLVVRVKSVKLGKLLGLVKLVSLDTEKLTPEDLALIDDVFQTFADSLVSWNVEDDDDQPVPPTLDGVYSQDLDFIMEIVAAWVDGLTGVSDPLAGRSRGGGTSQEASLPMEVLSPSRAS